MMPGFRMGDELLDSHGYQTFQTAFRILDKDMDGRLSESEAYRLVAYYNVSVLQGPPQQQQTACSLSCQVHQPGVFSSSLAATDCSSNSYNSCLAVLAASGPDSWTQPNQHPSSDW
jgi:hypothetical protein